MQNFSLHIYFSKLPETNRFFPGDKYIRPIIRQLVRGRKTGSIEKVFNHLCMGFDLLGIPYQTNTPFHKLKSNDLLIVLGTGRECLKGYTKSNPIIAGIGLMTHPSEWPDLCTEYPVVKYLQHSQWAKNVYIPYYGNSVCDIWPAGIETEKWKPGTAAKDLDFIIYNKIPGKLDQYNNSLRLPIIKTLTKAGLTFQELIYGSYKEEEYHLLLSRSRAMIFLSEHESQGFACCEAMAMDVPVLAWEQGFCLDPNRFEWKQPVIPASSIPYFDERCGERFKDFDTFNKILPLFLEKAEQGTYSPRKYILETLTLEKSAQRMLEIINSIN